MSLLTIVRSGVAMANKLTKSLQPQVTIEAWIGSDGFGDDRYGSPVKYDAIVNQEQKSVLDNEGETVETKAYVAVLQPIAPNGAPNRVEPLDRRDRVTLPDGTTGPIVRTSGFIDAGTKRPILHEFYVGL